MKLCVHIFALLSLLQRFSVTEAQTALSCVNGEIRLVGGAFIPTGGRVEICLNNEWNTVCDDRWDVTDSRVVCRQLGFSDEDSRVFPRAFFGEGVGKIVDVSCSGNETHLANCTLATDPICFHSEDAGVLCRYNGEVSMVHNRQVVQNNTVIALEDIGPSIIICLTNKYPCCDGDGDYGSWYHPDGSKVVVVPSAEVVPGNFYQRSYFTQTLVLFRSASANFPSGIFHCEINDTADVRRSIYIGIYKDGSGAPFIDDVRYNRSSQTIICTSSGGPATSVTWTRDTTPLNIDGTTYQHSQIITDTVTATYENRLTIFGDDQDAYGTYVCTVSNVMGSDSSEIKLSVCEDGDVILELGMVTALCYDGVWYRNGGLVNPSATGSARQRSDTDSLVSAALGALLGLTVVILIVVVIVICVWVILYKYTHKNASADNISLTEVNQHEESNTDTGEHMVRNNIYGSADPELENYADKMSPNVAYSLIIERRESEIVRPNAEYETINETGSNPGQSQEISYERINDSNVNVRGGGGGDHGYSKLDHSQQLGGSESHESHEEQYEIPSTDLPSSDRPPEEPYSHLSH